MSGKKWQNAIITELHIYILQIIITKLNCIWWVAIEAPKDNSYHAVEGKVPTEIHLKRRLPESLSISGTRLKKTKLPAGFLDLFLQSDTKSVRLLQQPVESSLLANSPLRLKLETGWQLSSCSIINLVDCYSGFIIGTVNQPDLFFTSLVHAFYVFTVHHFSEVIIILLFAMLLEFRVTLDVTDIKPCLVQFRCTGKGNC